MLIVQAACQLTQSAFIQYEAIGITKEAFRDVLFSSTTAGALGDKSCCDSDVLPLANSPTVCAPATVEVSLVVSIKWWVFQLIMLQTSPDKTHQGIVHFQCDLGHICH